MSELVQKHLSLADRMAGSFSAGRLGPGACGLALDRNDCMQAARLALCEAAESYDPSAGEFRPYASVWIFWRLVQASRDEIRHAGRVDLGKCDEQGECGECRSIDPRGEIEDIMAVREILAGLPDLHVRALTARYGLDGNAPMAVGDIAAHLGIAERTCERALANALGSLRARLA